MIQKCFAILFFCASFSLFSYQPQGGSAPQQSCRKPLFYESRCPFQIDVSGAFDDFRSLPEGSWTGNMGAFASVYCKAQLPMSFFFEFGGSYGIYDWNGRTSTANENSSTVQQQEFLTGAFTWETADDFGVNAGFAFDCLFNQEFGIFAVNPFLDQIRGQLGYLFLRRHELGAWATYGIQTAHKTAQQLPLKFRAISQANLFYCHYFPAGGFAMIWAGSPYRQGLMYSSGRPGSFLLGARMSAPLSNYISLFGRASFMGGRSTSTTSRSQNNASDVCVGLTFSFGRRKIQQTPYMSLADNSSFIADTNQNF